MTLALSHTFLQEYWWLVVSVLASLLVFLMFVQGGQTFIFSLARNEMQKTMLVNALGRKWEFTFTTLVTFGGAFFAAFPLFYATSFGGAYWVWMAILFSFIIQAIAYEFRSKPSNVYGKKTFDIFLLINGSVGPFLIGVAVATFFTGSQFRLNFLNQVTWQTPWHGLEALLSVRNLSLGFAVLFLARILGLQYIINSVDDDDLSSRSRKNVLINTIPFLVAFLFFVITLLVSEGFAVDPQTGVVTTEKFKYASNLFEMPAVLILFLAGTLLVLSGIYLAVFTKSHKPVWYSGSGTILVVLALFMLAGYNNTSFYPSLADLNSSLTIRNASSSHFTLRTMFYISFGIPFVIAYIWYAWKAISNKKITPGEMESEHHVY
ncbi:MAG: cytochrome d ubiquinol oxidase subunit II [Bacteroidetes bacterium]|nr:cytochrome d ubiquinol oxidase subunit II [Bacteroidota bacterium]